MKATDGCLRDVRTGTGRPIQEMLIFKKFQIKASSALVQKTA
jgi:hypothetical protein